MNRLKKMYCRVFQTGLKAALPFLPYRKPRIVGSVKALRRSFRRKAASKSCSSQMPASGSWA